MCLWTSVRQWRSLERPDMKLNDDSNEWGSNDLGLQRLVLIQARETVSQAGGCHTHTHTHVSAQTQYKVETHGEPIHVLLCTVLLCVGNTAQSIKLLHTHCSVFYYFPFSALYPPNTRKRPPLFISMTVWEVLQPAVAHSVHPPLLPRWRMKWEI